MSSAKLAAKKADLQILHFHRRQAEETEREGGRYPETHAQICDTIAKLSR